MKRRVRAQALVEFALTLPLLAFSLIAMFQFILIFFVYLSVLNLARDAGRWVAVHPNRSDSTTISDLSTHLPSNLQSSNIDWAFTPPCSTTPPPNCPNRAAGQSIKTTITYYLDRTPNNVVFLPTTFGLSPWFVVRIPSGPIRYELTVMADPDPNG